MHTVIIAIVHNNTADAKSSPLLWDTHRTTEELFGEAQPTMAASEKPVDTSPVAFRARQQLQADAQSISGSAWCQYCQGQGFKGLGRLRSIQGLPAWLTCSLA